MSAIRTKKIREEEKKNTWINPTHNLIPSQNKNRKVAR